MNLSQSIRQRQKANTAPAPAVNSAVLRLSNDELHAIINHNERAIEQGKVTYPYLSKMHLVGKLNGQGKLYDYWAIKCLADVRFSAYLVPLEKRQKHGIVYCDDDNQFHPTKPTTKKAIERYRATHRPRPNNTTKFDFNDIEPIHTPLPDFVKKALWTADSLKTAPRLENTGVGISSVVDSKFRQISPKTPNNLSEVYGITAHQFYKYSQIEFANSLLPSNHPIVTTMKTNTGKVAVYGDNDGRIYTKGGNRTRKHYSVFDNCHDGQKANEYAKGVQVKLLEQGYAMQKGSLYYPHDDRNDIEIDLPLLNKTEKAFMKEFIRQLGKHLKQVDISMRLVSLENPLTKDNGYHPHFHPVFITKPLKPKEQAIFEKLFHQTWLRALKNSKLIDKNATPSNVSHIKFNDDNALAYVTKYDHSYHTPDQMDEIESRWLANKSITVFELISLANYGRIDKAIAKKHYRALLNAMKQIEKIKYSKDLKDWCEDNGLLEPINAPNSVSDDTPSDDTPSDLIEPQTHDRPLAEPIYSYQHQLFNDELTEIKYQSRRKGQGSTNFKSKHPYDPVLQLTFAPKLELLYQQAIERAKRPKRQQYRRFNDTDYSSLNLLVTFDGAEWAKLCESYEYLAVLNRIRDDYRAGRFNAKPSSYYAEHPRPS